MASRSIFDLVPAMQGLVIMWLEACRKRGVEVLVYCTLRPLAEQAELYAIGRTKPGKHWKTGEMGFGKGHTRTNAEPGSSWHNFGRALDAVPMVHGKPDWSYSDVDDDRVPDEEWWRVMVEEAKRIGLEWAGDWKNFKEFVHFQWTNGESLSDVREAARRQGRLS